MQISIDGVKVTFSTMVEINPQGNSTAPCLDSKYDATFIIGAVLLSAHPDRTIYPESRNLDSSLKMTCCQ